MVRKLPVVAVMVWLALAPTWKVAEPKEPSSSFWPLNSVVPAMRSSSDSSWPTSAWMALRSPAELVALADCTDSSRTRCRMFPAPASALSATWDSEMPSLALRAAWFIPRICEVNRSEMARPAASSLALLMRRPEDRRWMEVLSDDWLRLRLRWAVSELMLVLMVDAMAELLRGWERTLLPVQALPLRRTLWERWRDCWGACPGALAG